MPKFFRCATVLLCSTLAAACTPTGSDTPPDQTPANDEGDAKPDDGREVEVEVEVEVDTSESAKITVASVQMIQDCPDREIEAEAPPGNEPARSATMPAPSPPASAARRKPSPDFPMKRNGAGDVPDNSFRQPCSQSSVQLAIDNTNEHPVAVEIKAVRLLSEGKRVATLETRRPKFWANNTYESWDQQVAPGAPIRVSYKLSMPSWYEVEKAIGESSFGHMFTLEIDVMVDGKLQTVSSQQFPREQPHVIVT